MRVMGFLIVVIVLPLMAWAILAGVAWIRYGRHRPVRLDESDPLLDEFMAGYEVAERSYTHVDAPMELTFAAAAGLDLAQSGIVRGIFRGRELLLGSPSVRSVLPKALFEWAKALGWGVLAEVPGREIVFGAVTRPWEPNLVLRRVPAEEFAAFREPGYVKIVWTLRADAITVFRSIARTETRVATTDAAARAKFRLYWAFLSPGIVLIRLVALGMVKREAERNARRERRVATV